MYDRLDEMFSEDYDRSQEEEDDVPIADLSMGLEINMEGDTSDE